MWSLKETGAPIDSAPEAERGKARTPETSVDAAVAVTAVQTLRARVFCGFLFAAIEEALVVVSTTWRAHGGSVKSAAAALEALCFLAFPLVVVAAPFGALLTTTGARTLGRHLRAGMSGEKSALESVGVFLASVAAAGSVVLGWKVGFRASDFQSARVATLASALATLAFLVGGALAATTLVPPAGALLRRLPRRLLPPEGIPVADLAVAGVGIAALYGILPPSHAITPAAGFVGFALGPTITTHIPSAATASRAPLLVLAPLALLSTLGAGTALKHLPDAVQIGLLARSPYGSIAITAIRRLFDRDHDGYSAILGGGDCNDADPDIHPNARDVPDNGIDENCSGGDAHHFAPATAPVRDRVAPAPRDNIILVHIDALRPDHVGFAGYRRPTTPNIDRWREGATWFKNAYTPAPSTRFALSMIFTGLEVEQIPQRRGSAIDFTLLPEAVTLAERLTPLGYDRVGYTLSYVLQHITDVGQGFRVWQTPWPVEDWRDSYQDSAHQTSDAAIKYLETVPADGTRPYLLFLHYECTHDPYIKHSTWDYGDRDVDRYDSALNYCDQEVGRVLGALDARADRDRNAVFLYSDHGELFGEHGFTRHGNTLFEPDVRALLLAKIPGATAKEIDTPMYLTDMTPTIYELTGLPPDPACQGWSLVPYLNGAPLPPRQLFLYGDLWRDAVHFNSRGVLDADGKTKFVYDVSAGMRQLYDLTSDPDELMNVADANPALASKLAERVDSWEAYVNRDGRSFETVNKEKR